MCNKYEMSGNSGKFRGKEYEILRDSYEFLCSFLSSIDEQKLFFIKSVKKVKTLSSVLSK